MHSIDFTATEEVKDAIRELGRTEDVTFSPNSRRLAVAGFLRKKIVIFDVDIATSSGGKKVNLTGFQELISDGLKLPHGLSFIDDETLAVANRAGEVPILKLPPGGTTIRKCEVSATVTICNDQAPLLDSPSSVTVSPLAGRQYSVLICNNKANSVTRHILERDAQLVVKRSEVLLNRGLVIPDGVAVNRDGRWIAVSNHQKHSVFLYENTPKLNSNSRPDGILRNVNYPHGVCFTPDDKFVLVADAGAPYINVYAKEGQSWKGRRDVISSFRVMDEELYLQGRSNPEEGGPKGIAIDRGMNVLVTTSKDSLAFFDLPAILQRHEVPMDWRVRVRSWRKERLRSNIRAVRNNLGLRTRLRRIFE